MTKDILVPPTQSPRPQPRPEVRALQFPSTMARSRNTEHQVDMKQTTNPITQLAQVPSNNEFETFDERNLNVRGAYIPPQHIQGIEYEGGEIPEGMSQVADWHRRVQGRTPRFNEVFLSGGGMNPQTAAHEFMHRGLNMLRSDFTREEVAERYGDETARALYSRRLEHPLIQAMFESQGHESFNDYIGNMDITEEEKRNVFRAILPLSDMAIEALADRGFEELPAAPEDPEDEANRKLLENERKAMQKQSATFLQNVISFFIGSS